MPGPITSKIYCCPACNDGGVGKVKLVKLGKPPLVFTAFEVPRIVPVKAVDKSSLTYSLTLS